MRLQKWVGGAPDPMIDWRQSDLIEQGADAENLLGVIAHGSKILLLANEQLLAYVVDDSLDQGDVALAAAEGAVAAFDDLAVWDAGPAADLLAALDEREAAAEPEPAAEAEAGREPAQDEPPAFDVAMLDTDLCAGADPQRELHRRSRRVGHGRLGRRRPFLRGQGVPSAHDGAEQR